jgi:phage terminase large subunit
MEVAFDGVTFRSYLETKYKGVEIKDPSLNRTITVKDIYDLRFEDLELEDQRLALHPQVGWAWGVYESGKTLDTATKFAGYLFRPKQRAFWWAEERFPLYIGAFGSGKSLLLWLKCIQKCLAYPGTRGVYMRATYPQLEKSSLPTFFKIAEQFGWVEGKEFTHNVGKHYITFNNGSQLLYMPAKNEGSTVDKAIADLRSLEIDFAATDEVVDIDNSIHMALGDRIGRWGKIPIETDQQLMGAGNPPAKGTWVHKKWYLRRHTDDKKLADADEHALWVSSTYENKRNLPESYIRGLEAKPDWYKEAYLYGRLAFQPPEGTPVFGDFDYGVYVSKKTLEVHEDLPIVRGHDLGPTSKNKACIIGQVDPRGILLIFAEVLVEEIGIGTYFERVVAETKRLFPGDPKVQDFCDPVAMHPSQTDSKSAADIGREYGINMFPGEERTELRLDAVSQVMHRLVGGGVPGMVINPHNCQKLIEGFMGGYRYKVVDISHKQYSRQPVKDEYSHVMDALQYLCSRLSYINFSRQTGNVRDKARARNNRSMKKQRTIAARLGR